MAVNPVGKPYTPQSADELRDNWLRDVRLECLAQGLGDPPVQPGTDLYIRATALANAHLIQYANISLAADDQNPLTAAGAALDDIRKGLGLPEVPASPAAGKVVIAVDGGGSVLLPDASVFVLPNGLRGKTVGAIVVSDGTEVSVITTDKGSAANLAAGKLVRFVAPPLSVKTDAAVSVNAPLTGGADEETDERKRARILNRLATPPLGGNWSQKIEHALNAHPGIQYAFVYPALGGPASEKIVLVRAFDADTGWYSREVSTDATATVRAAIHAQNPIGVETIVQSVLDSNSDCSVVITLPEAGAAAGGGLGWVDPTPWPLLDDGVSTFATVGAYAGSVVLPVVTLSLTSPAVGMHIAHWSPRDMRFHKRVVLAVSGASPTWSLTLDAPMFDSTGTQAALGEYISPEAYNMDAYGSAMLAAFQKLGPGENTADVNRVPRALRQPRPAEAASWGMAINARVLDAIFAGFPEVSDLEWKYRETITPALPADVVSAPYVLVPQNFGIYKKV